MMMDDYACADRWGWDVLVLLSIGIACDGHLVAKAF
jgi:hypothetical protein